MITYGTDSELLKRSDTNVAGRHSEGRSALVQSKLLEVLGVGDNRDGRTVLYPSTGD
jgi:hypothetical protein